jgi:hypothetical protein
LRFSLVNEKKAISEPDANAEHNNKTTAIHAATTAPTDGIVKYTFAADGAAACSKAVKNISKTQRLN